VVRVDLLVPGWLALGQVRLWTVEMWPSAPTSGRALQICPKAPTTFTSWAGAMGVRGRGSLLCGGPRGGGRRALPAGRAPRANGHDGPGAGVRGESAGVPGRNVHGVPGIAGAMAWNAQGGPGKRC